jgi:hypothetical protein
MPEDDCWWRHRGADRHDAMDRAISLSLPPSTMPARFANGQAPRPDSDIAEGEAAWFAARTVHPRRPGTWQAVPPRIWGLQTISSRTTLPVYRPRYTSQDAHTCGRNPNPSKAGEAGVSKGPPREETDAR